MNATCDVCENPIRSGERYVAYVRQVERFHKSLLHPRGAITVEQAEEDRLVHVGCDNGNPRR